MTKVLSHGIPHRIVRDNQSFQLVAMIDGAAANTQFIQNLQVLSQQRSLLAQASQQLASLPKSSSAEERSALQTQISQLDARVTLNMQFMTKNYGYSVQSNYLLSPVNSALLRKAVDEAGAVSEDEAKATVVAELHTTESYDELQLLRQRLTTLAQDESKKAEVEKIKEELKSKFSFDVNAHYILQIRKSALYATV